SRPAAFVPITRASIEAFSALVPASNASPTCGQPSEAARAIGHSGVSLIYDDPTRQVTVLLDATGNPTAYFDVRGDLSASNQRGGDRTTIGLYLTEGYA